MIVTSNADLESLVAAGRFRADLFFRLKQLRFDLPPLRKRPRDIVWLAVSMIQECCRTTGRSVHRVDPEFFELLKCYPWPGNIRDLRNEVHRAVLFCHDGTLTSDCLACDVRREAERARRDDGWAAKGDLADDVAQTEIEAIERMLRATDFNRAAAARALGISRVTLYNKIRKYRIRLDGDSRK
jgi:transcriptional regulator with PAS, ATPase and Fis domain